MINTDTPAIRNTDGGYSTVFLLHATTFERNQQIGKLKKQAERIEKWLKENDAKTGSDGRELKSNLTDNDSAMMLTSHGTIKGL